MWCSMCCSRRQVTGLAGFIESWASEARKSDIGFRSYMSLGKVTVRFLIGDRTSRPVGVLGPNEATSTVQHRLDSSCNASRWL